MGFNSSLSNLSSAFCERVLKEGAIDTTVYRYAKKQYRDHIAVARKRLSEIGKTEEADGWEVVWTVRDTKT